MNEEAKKERLEKQKSSQLSTVEDTTSKPILSLPSSMKDTSNLNQENRNNVIEHSITIQIRQPDGSTLRNTFQSSSTLSDVASFIAHSQKETKAFLLLTTFPRQEYPPNTFPQVTLFQIFGKDSKGVLTMMNFESKGVVLKGEGSLISENDEKEDMDKDDLDHGDDVELAKPLTSDGPSMFKNPTTSIRPDISTKERKYSPFSSSGHKLMEGNTKNRSEINQNNNYNANDAQKNAVVSTLTSTSQWILSKNDSQLDKRIFVFRTSSLNSSTSTNIINKDIYFGEDNLIIGLSFKSDGTVIIFVYPSSTISEKWDVSIPNGEAVPKLTLSNGINFDILECSANGILILSEKK